MSVCFGFYCVPARLKKSGKFRREKTCWSPHQCCRNPRILCFLRLSSLPFDHLDLESLGRVQQLLIISPLLSSPLLSSPLLSSPLLLRHHDKGRGDKHEWGWIGKRQDRGPTSLPKTKRHSTDRADETKFQLVPRSTK